MGFKPCRRQPDHPVAVCLSPAAIGFGRCHATPPGRAAGHGAGHDAVVCHPGGGDGRVWQRLGSEPRQRAHICRFHADGFWPHHAGACAQCAPHNAHVAIGQLGKWGVRIAGYRFAERCVFVGWPVGFDLEPVLRPLVGNRPHTGGHRGRRSAWCTDFGLVWCGGGHSTGGGGLFVARRV